MAQRQFRSDDTSKWFPKYGNTLDGDKTVSSNSNYDGANAGGGANAASAQKNVSIDAISTFSNNDLVVIHQTRGTGVGVWELNKIASGGGSTSLVMVMDLSNDYTESGASQFQVLQLKQFRNVVVNSGISYSATSWDGSKGGIIAFLAKSVSVVGTITAASKGYYGGDGASAGSRQGRNAEGSAGAGQSATTAANGSGGGGGVPDTLNHDGGGGGSGGSHATSGTAGTTKNNGGPGTAATTTTGNAGLTLMTFGGGGGEGGADDGGSWGRGGYGGGIVLVVSRNIEVTGSITTTGENGTTPSSQDGGHGGAAGGSILLKGQTITLGSSLVASAGGTGSVEASTGGNGGVGRNHVDYSKSLSGTTSPTLDSRQDSSLRTIYRGPLALFGFLAT